MPHLSSLKCEVQKLVTPQNAWSRPKNYAIGLVIFLIIAFVLEHLVFFYYSHQLVKEVGCFAPSPQARLTAKIKKFWERLRWCPNVKYTIKFQLVKRLSTKLFCREKKTMFILITYTVNFLLYKDNKLTFLSSFPASHARRNASAKKGTS